MHSLLKSGLVLGALIASSQASAVIVISEGPGNFPNDENVLYNVGTLISSGPLVQGITNQSNFIVNFSGAGENLVTKGGQARIEAEDGCLTMLTVSLADPNASFQTLVWNLNAEENGSVTFTVQPTVGAAYMQTFSLTGSGQNFFRFEAIGESIQSVSLLSTVCITDIKQVRLGGINVVPEPATMLLLGTGVLGMIRHHRRRKAV